MHIGSYIAGLRSTAGLTQEQVADRLGVSRFTYASREQGRCGWKASDLDRTLDIIGATGAERLEALRLAGEHLGAHIGAQFGGDADDVEVPHAAPVEAA